jgi:hypothetical protein
MSRIIVLTGATSGVGTATARTLDAPADPASTPIASAWPATTSTRWSPAIAVHSMTGAARAAQLWLTWHHHALWSGASGRVLGVILGLAGPSRR